MRPRYSLARKKATQLLRLGKVTAPPVPVERLVELVHAVLRYEPFDGDLSGMVHRRTDGAAVVGINSTHHRNRQRFTIAHEIGHLVLHDDAVHVDEHFPIGLRNSVSSQAVDPREIEANQFAAELLMPLDMLRDDLKGQRIDAEDESLVEELARRYLVSKHAMAIRLGSGSSLTL